MKMPSKKAGAKSPPLRDKLATASEPGELAIHALAQHLWAPGHCMHCHLDHSAAPMCRRARAARRDEEAFKKRALRSKPTVRIVKV